MSMGPTIVTVVPPCIIPSLLLEMFLDLLLECYPVPHHFMLRSLRLALPLILVGLLCLFTETCMVVIFPTVVVALDPIVPSIG